MVGFLSVQARSTQQENQAAVGTAPAPLIKYVSTIDGTGSKLQRTSDEVSTAFTSSRQHEMSSEDGAKFT